jgi:hypothetical protein
MSRDQLSKYRIRGVDRATPAQLLEPVTCLAIDNMVPVGPPENPYWTVPRPEEDVYQSGTALDVGTYADPPDAPGTTDLLILESGRLLRVDRSTSSSTTLYTFDTDVQIQGATFAQLDDAVYVAVRTSGITNGEPHKLLVVRGTDCYEWAPPQLPRLGVYASSHGTGTELIGSDQRVGMTYAFIFKDGSVGPFAMPSVINPTGGGATPKVYVEAEAGWTAEEQAFVQQHVDRIGIFMNGPLPDGSFSKWASVAWSGPYYQVAEIPATGGVDTETDVSIAPQDLSAQTTRIDDNILAWRPSAGAVYTYNGRLILGDVAYQQPIPNALHHVNESSAGETTADVNVRIGYVYDLGNEEVERISDAVTVPQGEIQSGTDESYVQGGVGQIDLEGEGKSNSSYFGNYHPWPDERVKRLRVYVAEPGASSYVRVYDEEYGTLYGQTDAEGVQFWRTFVEIPSGGEPPMPDVQATNAEGPERGGRIVYSEPYQPGYLKAENRADVDGRILALTSTGEPVSEGQFGQYPLLALCENSLWSLEVSSDPFISGISPLETDAGIVGRRAYANIGGQIIGATGEGVRQLTPRPQGEPLSAPLHDIEGRFLTSLGPATAIGHFTDDSAGRRELWVSAGGRTWVYSLPHGTWSSISRARVSYARPNGQLHAVTSNRDTVRETSSSDAEQPFSIVSTVFHVGEVGMMERLRQILIQQRFNCEELNWELVAKDPNAALVLDQSSLNRATLPDGLVARDLLPNVQIEEGTLVRGDIGTIHLEKALGYSWFIRMSGTAKPDQGIEAWGAVSEPRRRSRAPSMFPDQPETETLAFDVEITNTSQSVQVNFDDPDFLIAGVLWGDGDVTTAAGATHSWAETGIYTITVVAQPGFNNHATVSIAGGDKNNRPTLLTLPDLSRVSALGDEIGIRRLVLENTLDASTWPQPKHWRVGELQGGGDVPISTFFGSETVSHTKANLSGFLGADLFQGNDTLISLYGRGGSHPEEVITDVPETLERWDYGGVGDNVVVDLTSLSPNHSLRELGKTSGGFGTSTDKSANADRRDPSRDIANILQVPSFEYVVQFNAGTGFQIGGDVELREGIVRLNFYNAALTGWPTNFSASADTLEFLRLRNDHETPPDGIAPSPLPHIESTATTSSKDCQASVNGAWADRSSLKPGLIINWEENARNASNTVVFASSLQQEHLHKIIGTGIGTQYEEDGIRDYCDARHSALLRVGDALVSADATAQTITLDLSVLPIDPPRRFRLFPDPNSMPSEEDFRDVVFQTGNEFRLRSTGSVDGVYESAGATLNGSTLTVSISDPDGAHSLPATDTALTGECMCQFA